MHTTDSPKGSVRLERHDALRLITLCNEAKHNAFTHGMIDDFDEILDEIDRDDAVRCVVITGSGARAFSSGHSLDEMGTDDAHRTEALRDDPFIFTRPARMRVPVIAAVNGYAYGAGFIVALACDMRVADESARFCAPGSKVGLLPVGGQLSRLYRLMPYARAMELLYTGEPLGAKEAERLGFVGQVTKQGGALDAALAMAEKICANAPSVIRAIKQGVRHAEREGESAGDMFETLTRKLLRGNADMREGVSAFLEKRAPLFK